MDALNGCSEIGINDRSKKPRRNQIDQRKEKPGYGGRDAGWNDIKRISNALDQPPGTLLKCRRIFGCGGTKRSSTAVSSWRRCAGVALLLRVLWETGSLAPPPWVSGRVGGVYGQSIRVIDSLYLKATFSTVVILCLVAVEWHCAMTKMISVALLLYPGLGLALSEFKQ